MHLKFTSDNGLKPLQRNPESILNYWGEPYDWKTKTWACNQLKANNLSAEYFKKTHNFNELAPEPTIQSCDSGQ